MTVAGLEAIAGYIGILTANQPLCRAEFTQGIRPAVHARGKNGKAYAVNLLRLDGIPAHGLENWRDDKCWGRFDIVGTLTPAEFDALRK
jgi:hypothetical protein